MTISDDEIGGAVLHQVTQRGAGKSICPSEVARALAEDWRPLMPRIRLVAAALCRDGRVEILRHGKPVDPALLKGVIRLRLKPPEA